MGPYKGQMRPPISGQMPRDSKRDNSIGLIKCSSAFATRVSFLVSKNSGFSSAENWDPRAPVEDFSSYRLSFLFGRK